jgi:hypothetical protein
MIDVKQNFWKHYPELIFAPTMAELYNSDKTKNKSYSSKIMWAIHMCESPNSKFYNRPNKYTEIAEKFIKDSNFLWEDNQELLSSYKDSALTDAERALTDWNELMNFRKTHIRQLYVDAIDGDVDYDEEGNETKVLNTKQLLDLDKMLAATPKLFEDYKKIKQDYEEEKIKGKGKRLGSLTDEDVI